MLIVLALTLLLFLSVLRHLLEPACPGCTAKSWNHQAGILSCSRCGWSSAIAPQAMPTAEVPATQAASPPYAAAQYEIGFH